MHKVPYHTPMEPTKNQAVNFEKFLWLRANRGIFKRVARELGIRPSTVHKIFWGKATSERVYRALKQYGAPLRSPKKGGREGVSRQSTERRGKVR